MTQTARDRSEALWAVITPPDITRPEIERATKKLWRYALRESFTAKMRIVKRKDLWTIRFDWKGAPYWMRFMSWRGLCKGMADTCAIIEGGDAAEVEFLLVKEVIKRGWLDGRLRDKLIPPRTKAEIAEKKRSDTVVSIKRRIKAWSSKAKRAENALKKINTQLKRLEK
jgi:hypothetical protein